MDYPVFHRFVKRRFNEWEMRDSTIEKLPRREAKKIVDRDVCVCVWG